MYHKILVPLDRSEKAEMVIPYSIEIAVKFNSEIHLVTTAEPNSDSADPSYLNYFANIIANLENQSMVYKVKEKVTIHTRTLSGKPANEILSYADEVEASLIAMASHGSSGGGQWVLGNIAAKILRASHKPLLLIRAPASEDKIAQRRILKKILVPLDGSKLGEAAIPLVKALATGLNAEVILIHVDEPIITWGIYEDYPGYTASPPDPESRKASAIAYLDSVAKPLKDSGLTASSVMVFGLPARAIAQYTKDNDVDLIAISTHGRSGIAE
ncbi:universal stress protein [Chloroflexota bacterium]